jgi:ribosomal protein L17
MNTGYQASEKKNYRWEHSKGLVQDTVFASAPDTLLWVERYITLGHKSTLACRRKSVKFVVNWDLLIKTS